MSFTVFVDSLTTVDRMCSNNQPHILSYRSLQICSLQKKYLLNINILKTFIKKQSEGELSNILGNMVTVMSPDGKPIQVDASALQAAGAQNAIGEIETSQ